MKVAIASVQVPFITGGAELLALGLRSALLRRGHDTELITLPFRFDPPSAVERSMTCWFQEDFSTLAGGSPDRVICLKFPAYYLAHPHRTTWLLHQHRTVYDLWDRPDIGIDRGPQAQALRQRIIAADTTALAQMQGLFTISRKVSSRLHHYNGLASQPLYHPPPNAERLYTGEFLPYVFCPSRLEILKRQHLLIDAARHAPGLAILIAGTGGQAHTLAALVERLGLGDRVRLLGRVSDEEMRALYAHASAVFFGPLDEDYGYVTLEAMLSGKPVITCTDSGGPLEFVIADHTGWVVPPQPEAIGAALREAADAQRARKLGAAARAHYQALNIDWNDVVDQLLADRPCAS
jgi:glycosyltransferase involved in cell wall biosynthesis